MLKRIGRTEPEPPWSFLAAIGALIAMFLAVVIGTTIAQTILGAGEDPVTIMTGWAIGMVATIVFVLISRQRRSPQDADALKLKPTRSGLLLVMLFSFGVAIAFDLTSWLVTGEQEFAAAELTGFRQAEVALFGWVIALLFMGLLQPIAEELVFRGMLYPSVRAGAGPWAGFLVVAALHASFHLVAYPPSSDDRTIVLWYGLGLPLLDALYLNGVRANTGSTRASIAAHAALGLFAVLKVLALSA